jgi:hypothetical protein
VQDAYRTLLHTDQTIVDKLYAHRFAQTHGFSEENNSELPAFISKLTLGVGQILGRRHGGNKKTKDNLPKSHDKNGKSVHTRTTSCKNLDRNDLACAANEANTKMPTEVPATEGPYHGTAVVPHDPHTGPPESSETLQLLCCVSVVRASETKFKKLNSLLSPVQRSELKHARRFFKGQSEDQSWERTLRLKLLGGAETLLANALETFWKGSHGPEWGRMQ